MTLQPFENGQVPTVSLVIPGRNCQSTLERCLDSVVELLDQDQLQEIIFVDDGSTDTTADLVADYPVTVLTGKGRGPGAARNLGWRNANADLIWFIDSDCVAEPDALEKLLPHMNEPNVAGVGGSYANLYPDSLVATLIHEEIVARHRRMGKDVNFLATFNVIYQRDVLEQVGGFDESLKLAQDAELAYRFIAAGHRLRFELESRVGHHHARNLWRYMRTQCRQGYFRMMLFRSHPGMMSGDSYSGWMDYAQPPLACLSWAMSAAALFWGAMIVPAVSCSVLLLLLQWPMTRQCVKALGLRGVTFTVFGFVRAHKRAAGMVAGAIANAGTALSDRPSLRQPREPASPVGSKDPDSAELPDVTSVTIIIPSRDRADKLIKCLVSLENQTVGGFEVVVVNDGSIDDTAQQLWEYGNKVLSFNLVVINHQQPRGANPSRNAAIQSSRGQWIAMLDDDCFADQNWLRRMVQIRDQHNAIAVAGHVENMALSNQWERFFAGQQRVSSTVRHGMPIARRLVACNTLVHHDWLCGTLDEDRAEVSKEMATSGRGDEEGLRLAILRRGEWIIHAEHAIVFHDHPYQFSSFCRQAYKSGRSTARLARTYSLPPRWELVLTAAACLALPLAYFSNVASLAFTISFALAASAFLYNEMALKGKTFCQTLATLPQLVLYALLRTFGYFMGWLRPLRSTRITDDKSQAIPQRSTERHQMIQP